MEIGPITLDGPALLVLALVAGATLAVEAVHLGLRWRDGRQSHASRDRGQTLWERELDLKERELALQAAGLAKAGGP